MTSGKREIKFISLQICVVTNLFEWYRQKLLAGNTKKIAKFLVTTFTGRSTFLYALAPPSPSSYIPPIPPPRSLLSFPGGKWVQFGMVQKGKWGGGRGERGSGRRGEWSQCLTFPPLPFVSGWLAPVRQFLIPFTSHFIHLKIHYRKLCKFVLQQFCYFPIFALFTIHLHIHIAWLRDGFIVFLFIWILKIFNWEISNTRKYFVKYRLQNENENQLKCHRYLIYGSSFSSSMSLQGKEKTLKFELAQSVLSFRQNNSIEHAQII